MIYLANDSIHYQTVFIPRQSYQSGTTRNPDYGSGLTSGDVINLITQSDAFERVVYDPTTKRIYFYNGEGTPATTSVDCTDFIKDGMVSEVKIENGYLIIVFNTDSGKENISIPLTDIFNPDNYYTKTETDTKLGEKQNNLVSGQNIKTINRQSILGPGNIEIKGTEYEAGENIDITGRVISVTGITVPTKTSELTNDSGFITEEALAGYATEEWVEGKGYLTEHQSLSAYSTTEEMNQAISSATQDMATTGDLNTLKTEIEAEIPDVSDFVTSGEVQTKIDNAIATETARTESTYLKEHQSLSAYSTTEQVQSMINSAKTEVEAEIPTKTSELTNDSGFLTEHQSLSAYSTTQEMNTAIDNAIAVETARTESTYLKEHQSLSAYSTTVQVQGMIDSAKTEIESEIPDVSNFITSGQAQSQIDSAITTETARTENVYAKKTDIPVVPTSNTAFTNDAGYITEDALDGYATEEWVEGKGYLTEHQSLSAYSTTQEMNTAIDNATSGKQDTLIAGTNIDITNNTVSVTGITIPDVSEFVTSGEVQTQINDSLTGYSTTEQMNSAISSATQDMATTGDLNTLKTEVEAEIPTKVSDLTNDAGYLTQHQSLNGLFASVNYVSSAKTIYFYDKSNTQVGSVDATEFIKDGMVDNVYISGGSLCISFNTDSGKETITIPLTDIFNPNNYYDKTAIDNIIASETARTESTYLKEHQSLSAYSTTEQVQSMINSAKTEVEAEIPDVSNFVTSAQVETQITDKGYATTGQLNTLKTEIEAEIPDVSDFVTSGEVQTQINDSISGIPTQFKTINNESIIGSGNIEISAGTTYSAGTNIDITNNTISVTGITVPTKTSDLTNDSGFVTSGDVEERVEGFEETTSRALNDLNTRVNSKQDTLVSGTNIKTINNESIIGSGNIEISAGTEYEAGTNIDITNNTISVTGITIPDVSNFITSGQAQSQIDSAITAETARTENVYAKKTDIPVVPTSNTAFTNDAGYITEDALDGYASEEWVEGKGYLTEHQSLSAYSTTQEMNTAIDNATSGKQDTLIAGTNIDITNNTVSVTGITIPDVSQFITSGQAQSQIDSAIASETARTESTYLKEHQSLSAYSTTVQVQGMIDSAKTEVEAEIPTKTSELTNDSGFLTEHQSLSAYSTTQEMNTAISNATSGKQDTLVSGTNIKTVNNQSILGAGNIEISGGTTYSAGTNIDITNNTISVTGITIPDVSNFITSGQAQSQIDSTLQEYDAFLPSELSSLGFIKNDDTTDVNIINIRVLTQSAYDNLVSTSSVSETTIYIIKN